MKILSFILFFFFSFVLVSGTNNVIKVLSQISQCIGEDEFAINLKKSSSTMSEEETNDVDSEEDSTDDMSFFIICHEVNQYKFDYQSTKYNYFAPNEIVNSREANPIFIPPPNA